MTSLLITNAQVVTLDDDNRVIDGGSVYVEDDKIVDVGNLDAEALEIGLLPRHHRHGYGRVTHDPPGRQGAERSVAVEQQQRWAVRHGSDPEGPSRRPKSARRRSLSHPASW